MKTIIPLLLLTILTGCASVHKDPVNNPQSLNNDDLIKSQIAKIETMQREMERREQELKMQHLKEIHQAQIQAKNQIINTNCKFFCF
jgi:uncharacterized protein YcfL